MCLQKKVLHWIMDMLDEKPRGKTDFDHWLSDGAILVKGCFLYFVCFLI